MSDAPEQIWAWKVGIQPLPDFLAGQWRSWDASHVTDATEYVRADLHTAEVEALRKENERLKEALNEIARQKKTTELETEYDVEVADFEDGYDTCIDRARAALQGKTSE